jgi:hypothetical protein
MDVFKMSEEFNWVNRVLYSSETHDHMKCSDNLFKNFGFGINGRWWSEYEWTSTFADGMIPSTFVLDAQMSYAIPSLKSVIKLTGSNIGSNDYLQVIGAGRIGQIYTLGISINP